MKQNYTLLPQGEAYSPDPPQRTHLNRRRIWQWIVPGLLAVVMLLALSLTRLKRPQDVQRVPGSNQPACPQFPPLKALSSEREKFEREVKDEIDSKEFFDKSLKNMQGAIQIPTESFDDMRDVGEDPRWDIFADFHQYLEKTFPLV
jgi:Gly-Xaa carboxypeptidase